MVVRQPLELVDMVEKLDMCAEHPAGQTPAAIAVHPQRSPHPGQQLTGAEGTVDGEKLNAWQTCIKYCNKLAEVGYRLEDDYSLSLIHIFPFQAIPSRTADGSSFLQLPMKGCIPVPL